MILVMNAILVGVSGCQRLASTYLEGFGGIIVFMRNGIRLGSLQLAELPAHCCQPDTEVWT